MPEFVDANADFGICERVQNRQLHATALLARFEENFPPTLSAFRSGREQSFFAAGGGKRHDATGSEFGGFLEGPLKSVELHHGEKQRRLKLRYVCGNWIEECEVHAVSRDCLDPGEPDGMPVAQFVELTGLRAQDASKMVRGFSFHKGGLVSKVIDEEAAAHDVYVTVRKSGSTAPALQVSRRCP